MRPPHSFALYISFATERQLIERIAAQIQIAKPELVPPKAETEDHRQAARNNVVEEIESMDVAFKPKTGPKTAEQEQKKNPNPRAPRPPPDLLPSLGIGGACVV